MHKPPVPHFQASWSQVEGCCGPDTPKTDGLQNNPGTLPHMLKSHLGSFACHLHSNVCPTGSPSKYQDLLAIKLLWLPVFNNFISQPWKSATCNCDCESDFLHICRGPGFLEPQEQSSGHYKPWKNWEWEDRTIQWDKVSPTLPQQLDKRWLKFARSQVASWSPPNPSCLEQLAPP